jgi:3-isopropylmalate/(R)-2-methylmalate dehydratase small subunit
MSVKKELKIKGKTWVFGDDIDTDIIIATQYLINDLNEMKTHAFEIVGADFAAKVKPGDVIIAGKNFGCGSSRQQAVDVLKALGVGAVIAQSFARIFYRNAMNLGLPLIEVKDTAQFAQDKELDIAINSQKIEIINGQTKIVLQPFPEFILNMLIS